VIPPTELVIATCPYLLIPAGDTSEPRSVSVKTCAEAKLVKNRKTVIKPPRIFTFVLLREFPIVLTSELDADNTILAPDAIKQWFTEGTIG
jgi:hypothetical protein